ncbi:MAG: DUF2490 domain-containing protein [Saprospiraceae bacterium]
MKSRHYFLTATRIIPTFLLVISLVFITHSLPAQTHRYGASLPGAIVTLPFDNHWFITGMTFGASRHLTIPDDVEHLHAYTDILLWEGHLEGGRRVNNWLKAGIGATLRTYNPFELTARHEWRTYVFGIANHSIHSLPVSHRLWWEERWIQSAYRSNYIYSYRPRYRINPVIPISIGKKHQPAYANVYVEGLWSIARPFDHFLGQEYRYYAGLGYKFTDRFKVELAGEFRDIYWQGDHTQYGIGRITLIHSFAMIKKN